MKQEFIAINKNLILDMDDIIDINEVVPDKSYIVTVPSPYNANQSLFIQNVAITKESYKAFKKRKEKKINR